MKKILTNSLAIVAATMLTITSYAQITYNSDQAVASNKKIIASSPKTSKNLPIGLDERVSVATDAPVEWSKSPFGYTASYTIGETNHMATYNNESHYIDTFTKIEWNNSKESSVVKVSLLTSRYKDQEVVAYWKSSDPDENGYYLELKDKTGKQVSVWADNEGNFYDKPYDYTTKTLN